MSRPKTSPSQEFLDAMDRYGVKDWTNPLAFYDYHSAWESGERPTKNTEGHWKWSSKYKHPLSHERYIIEGDKIIDTITGKEATEEEKMVNDTMREDYIRTSVF